MNSVDELLEHGISSRINMFRESHIDLPCKATAQINLQRKGGRDVSMTKVLSSAAR